MIRRIYILAFLGLLFSGPAMAAPCNIQMLKIYDSMNSLFSLEEIQPLKAADSIEQCQLQAEEMINNTLDFHIDQGEDGIQLEILADIHFGQQRFSMIKDTSSRPIKNQSTRSSPLL